MFLFTGESGEQYGYRDGWEDNGVFLYTGEGQEGDMGFQAGNRAIREHAEEGKDLHLFQSLSKGKGYRYLGMFACPSWEYRRGKDVNGEERWVIVFHLIQQDAMQQDNVTVTPGTGTPIDQLREDAYKAAYRAGEEEPQEAKRRYFHRSAAVHNYVLARASGRCEVCSEPAPFRRSDGTPYLEPHHTRRLADGGPDHPRWVAAICPNCHREIHHGVEGDTKNTRLQWLLGKLEG